MIWNKKYTSNNDRHKEIMFDIIKDIFSSSIKTNVAFKWWTLCMFLYWLDRFSIDLDFDIIKDDIPFATIKEITKDILKKYGKIQEETKTKIIVKYSDIQKPLKIEFNTRIYKHNTYEIKNFFGTSIFCMTIDSLFANKLVALSERNQIKDKVASRDVYDVYFFFKHHFEINSDILLERTWKIKKEYLLFLLDFIPKHFNQENILRWLWELIDEKQKYWIKNNLIQEVIWMITFAATI